MKKPSISLIVLLGLLVSVCTAKQSCEVCESFLQKFQDYAGDDLNDLDTSEKALREFCKKATGKDESFCYYIGALETSATKILSLVTKPMSYGKPVEKVCKELGKKDAEICQLKYEKKIDINEVDLKSLRVKELKKILTGWGEMCRGCAEKRDFIDKINAVKHLHVEL